MTDVTITPATGALSLGLWPTPQPVTPEQAFRMAMANPTVPKFYANTFTNFVGGVEVAVLFGIHGAPAGVVSISYPLAKALAAKLSEAVSQYEEKTHSKVADPDELNAAISQGQT